MGALAQIVVGLGFGDEGKGTIVDWLARQGGAHTVVRFNGGAQAAHNVVQPDGRHHCFAQFGSGTFAGARTHLSKFMLVNPIFARTEALALERVGISDPFSRMTVHEDAMVTTPFHVSMNRLRELARGGARHGSCGMGIGETVADSLLDHDLEIRVRDLRDPHRLKIKLLNLQSLKVAQAHAFKPILPAGINDNVDMSLIFDSHAVEIIEQKFKPFADKVEIVGDAWLRRTLEQPGRVIFEGAQGTLLDETYGFAPYTTWSTTTFANALRLVSDADVSVQKLGVLRAFHTRHGAGPFPTEDPELQIQGEHNVAGTWQGNFRVGHLDLVMLRYALEVNCLSDIALTWLDGLGPTMKICTHYESDDHPGHRITELSTIVLSEARTRALMRMRPVYETIDSLDLLKILKDRLGVRVVLTSCGPTHESKIIYTEPSR